MRQRLPIRPWASIRPVVTSQTGKWRRLARRTWYDLRANSRNLGEDEWIWIGLFVLWGVASGYLALYAAGADKGLW
jgi:hypothetical protein